MLVYYLVLTAVIFITVADNRLQFNIERKIGKQAFILIALLLICVAGLRYGVGSDYFFYYENYDFYRTSELVLDEEPVYKILARISAIIYKDPATLMFICAAFTIGLMLVPIYKNSVMPLLSLMLFLFLGTWHGTFNGIRQYLAAAVLFAGHRFIKEKSFWKWCLVVLAAYFCHVTAAVAIIFYPFAQSKISVKQLLISIVLIISGLFAYDYIFEFIGYLKDDPIELNNYITNSIKILRIAVAWVPVVFFLLHRKRYDTEDTDFRCYFNLSLLNAVCMSVASQSAYLGRIGIYLNVFNTITWPLLIKPLDERNKKVTLYIMIPLYLIYWSVEISGIDLRNFVWIFER